MMKFLQKLGKAIMIPVACLPLCGILMGLGYLLCPVSMQGGAVTGIGAIFGLYLVKAGGALIDNIAILFAVGIGVGMADNEDRIAGIAALISWLMIVNLLNADFVRTIASAFVSDTPALLAFQKIENPFIGIIAGLVGAGCYNRFKDTRLPEWLAFFSGKRSTLIAAGLASVLVSVLLMFVWPLLFGGLTRLGQAIAGMGAVGAGLYAFLNRLLLPMGLHHALNNVFWFDTIGLGARGHHPLLGRPYRRGCFLVPGDLYVRFLPLHDVRCSGGGAGHAALREKRTEEICSGRPGIRRCVLLCVRHNGAL